VKIIGITGISGSGKTLVTKILAKLGGFAVETDPMTHALMKKGQPAHSEITAAFGTDILDENGEILRKALGDIVFSDSKKLKQLESIIHPKVAAKTAELISQAQKTGNYKFAIIDAPLLIEAGMHKNCHTCWLITANHETRLARIIARDNITQESAQKRLDSRPGDITLRSHADIIIENNCNDIKALTIKVKNALHSSFDYFNTTY